MKTTVRIIAVLMAALMVCFAFAACGEQEEGSTIATSKHSGKEYASADFTKVSAKIKADTPKEYQKLIKNINSGKYDNKVVQVEGVSSRMGDNARIVQDFKKGIKVGLPYYVIDSTFPTDYPSNGTKIRVKGVVVVSKTNGSRYLEVPKGQLETI